MLSCVVEVDDVGRFGEVRLHEVPDPGRAVTQDDHLLGFRRASPAGLRVDEGAEVLDGFQGGDVARGERVSDRVALVVGGALGEDHPELYLPGVCPPVGVFALSANGVGRHRGYPGAIYGYVQLGDRAGRSERRYPVAAARTVVVGPAVLDRTEDGVEGLCTVGDELGLM